METRMVVLDPTYEAFTQDLGKTNIKPIAAAPERGKLLRIGLLSNGKKNGVELLETVFAELSRRSGMTLELAMDIVKPSISVPPTDLDMARLISNTDVVITAIGD